MGNFANVEACTRLQISTHLALHICTHPCKCRCESLHICLHTSAPLQMSAPLHTSEALHIWAHPCTLPTAHTLQPPRMHQERPPHSHPCGTPEGLPRRGPAPCTPSANSKPRSGGDSSSLQPPRMPRQRANTRTAINIIII